MGSIFEPIRSRARSRRRRERTAFVLGGGGILGAIQVGQLEALIDAGIRPDLFVGTSVGAMNAAAIAARPDREGIECLRDTWLELRTEDVFPGSRFSKVLNAVRRGDALYPNDGVRRLIGKVQAQTFEQMQVPLSVCAANLHTGAEQWFDAGAIEPAILASCAIPGVFPPVMIDGERFVDGGVVNNLPVSRAVELGATTIYVLTCGQARPVKASIRRPLDVLVQSFAHSRARRVEIDRQRFGDAARIIELPVLDTTGIGYDDTSQSRRLYAEALEASRAFLRAPVSA